MRLQIDVFGGMVPIIEASKLPVKNAELAENCRFDGGDLSAYNGLQSYIDTLNSGTDSLFLYAGQYWFSWPGEVNPVVSPINNDAYDRVYFTGDGAPKVTANTIATGSGAMPLASYRMGVQQPDPPVVTATNNNTEDGDTTNNTSRFYLTTYVNGFGEESMPSNITDEVEIRVPSGAEVELTLNTPTTNDQNIEFQRIYRSNGNDYQLVGQVAIGTTTFTDTLEDDELGVVLDTFSFSEPMQNMQGLTGMTNGILAGFSGYTIAFSEAYLPHAWPVEYEQTTEWPIVGIKAVGNSVVVGTEGNPYLFSGVSPDAISSQKLPLAQGCVSSRSMVDMGNYVIYASPDGLVAVSPGNASLITANIINKEIWQSYQPETIRAGLYEGKYLAFYGSSKGFIFDPQNLDFVELDFTAQAIYSDLKTDTLYFSDNDTLYGFDSADDLSYTWKKTIRLNYRSGPTVVFIDCDDPANVGFTYRVDGVELASHTNVEQTSTDQEMPYPGVFRLPGHRGKEIQITLTGSSAVHRVVLSGSINEALNG